MHYVLILYQISREIIKKPIKTAEQTGKGLQARAFFSCIVFQVAEWALTKG